MWTGDGKQDLSECVSFFTCSYASHLSPDQQLSLLVSLAQTLLRTGLSRTASTATCLLMEAVSLPGSAALVSAVADPRDSASMSPTVVPNNASKLVAFSVLVVLGSAALVSALADLRGP